MSSRALPAVPAAPATPLAAEGVVAQQPNQLPAQLPSFDELYRQHWRYVAGIAERLILRREEVRDIVQDVFLRAYRGLDQIENAAAVKGWLATITVRAVTDRLRRRKWQQALMLEDSKDVEHIPTLQAGPEEMVELKAVYAVLNRMPSKERVAWMLRYVEQEPLEVVAKLCNCSLATVKRRIAAAQEKLRELDATPGKRRG